VGLSLSFSVSLELEVARSQTHFVLSLFLVKLCWLLLLMSLLNVVGFGLKVGHLILMLCCWIVSVIYMNWFINGGIMDTKTGLLGDSGKMWLKWWEKISGNSCKNFNHYYQYIWSRRVPKAWWKKLLITWLLGWLVVSLWIFWYMSIQATEKRKETLSSMCDERARMLQDQFNVSMNHIQAMSILISTFHHGKNPSAIDQVT
jgi:histidine kinase 2/3/4 (cytokinin receptor)